MCYANDKDGLLNGNRVVDRKKERHIIYGKDEKYRKTTDYQQIKSVEKRLIYFFLAASHLGNFL